MQIFIFQYAAWQICNSLCLVPSFDMSKFEQVRMEPGCTLLATIKPEAMHVFS
jgi:hypothetical protein